LLSRSVAVLFLLQGGRSEDDGLEFGGNGWKTSSLVDKIQVSNAVSAIEANESFWFSFVRSCVLFPFVCSS
jgi:hypothetical protein